MISLFVIMVIIIALAAGAGYGLIALVRSSETALLIQRNQVRMDAVANIIRSYVTVEGGRVLVPATLESGKYVDKVPSFSPFVTTTWGKPIVYCPVRLSGSGSKGDSVSMSAGGSYPVSIETLNNVRKFVANGGPDFTHAPTVNALSFGGRHENVVAFVISPEINGTAIPSCNQVRLADDSTFTVTGGIVTAIYYAPSQASATTRQIVFSANGSLPIGAAPGTQVVSTIDQATETITRLGLSETTIRFFDDSSLPRDSQNFVSAADMARLALISAGRRIRLVGEAGAKIRILHGSTPANSMSVLRADGSFELENIEVEGWSGSDRATAMKSVDVGFAAGPTGKLSMRDTVIGAVRNLGGEVVLLPNVSVRPAYSTGPESGSLFPIMGSGGRIFIDGGSSSLVVSPGALAGVYVRGGDVTAYGPIGMTVSATGEAFWADRGGRILQATPSATVDVNGGGADPIMGSAIFGDKNSAEGETVELTSNGISRSLVVGVTQTCADGSESCTAACPADSVVAWGECGSSNGFALAGFGADATGRQWSCRWASPSTAVSPNAKAVCSRLP